MANKIKELRYNYVIASENVCEDYETATVGKNGVIEIEEHAAQGSGDKWYYDIIYKEEIIRIFRPDYVKFINQ